MSSTPVEKVRENPLELFSQIKEQGLLGLVLKDQAVSEKTLATAIGLEERLLCQGSGEKRRGVSGYDRICFDWYVLQEFSHFDREVSADRALSYEVEYLIAGKASDRENLEAVVLRLLAMREVQNAEVILTDPTMMGQAYEIALALAGASVNPALVQVVQVAVVAVWALVESILDLRALLDGKKIPMLKTRAQWKSQLGGFADGIGWRGRYVGARGDWLSGVFICPACPFAAEEIGIWLYGSDGSLHAAAGGLCLCQNGSYGLYHGYFLLFYRSGSL